MARSLFRGAALLLCASLLGQIYLAGLAIFGASGWNLHLRFVHFFEWIVIALPLIALFGRRPVRTRWLSFVPAILMFVQYVTVKGAFPQPVAALHPLDGAVFTGTAAWVAWRG